MPSIRAYLLKLDIGSGDDDLGPDWTTLDLYNRNAEYQAPMWDLPFGEASVSVIACTHALEHIPGSRVADTLAEWRRVLQPGGEVSVEVPDLDWCMRTYLTGFEEDRDIAYRGIYGAEGEGKHHLGGFDYGRLLEVLTAAGFESVFIGHGRGYGGGVLIARGISP